METKPPTPERLAHLGALTSGLAHELRNPLNAIKANLELMEEDMLREEEGDGPHTRRVRRLLKEVGRLDRILSNFLAFVRGDEIRPRRADLSIILAEVVSLITPQADAQGVTILSDLSETLFASIDPEGMKQAIMNLAMNGLQAMEEVPSGATLIIRLRRDACEAVIEVTDTGKGIPADRRERIFDLFFTTRQGGTGIGLAVVSRIIAAHGGSIACESEEGRGTSFRIRLPIAE
jgi:signal transduction histidine kinase